MRLGVLKLADSVDPVTRSRMMASVRSRDTGPEVVIRKSLHKRGFRYRTNDSKLPGRPDIVFPKYRAAVLVHGCFWHGHDCSLFRMPGTRREFWADKLRQNRERDEKVRQALHETGWRCLTVWECALRGPEKRDFAALIEEVAHWVTTGGIVCELRGIQGQ